MGTSRYCSQHKCCTCNEQRWKGTDSSCVNCWEENNSYHIQGCAPMPQRLKVPTYNKERGAACRCWSRRCNHCRTTRRKRYLCFNLKKNIIKLLARERYMSNSVFRINCPEVAYSLLLKHCNPNLVDFIQTLCVEPTSELASPNTIQQIFPHLHLHHSVRVFNQNDITAILYMKGLGFSEETIQLYAQKVGSLPFSLQTKINIINHLPFLIGAPRRKLRMSVSRFLSLISIAIVALQRGVSSETPVDLIVPNTDPYADLVLEIQNQNGTKEPFVMDDDEDEDEDEDERWVTLENIPYRALFEKFNNRNIPPAFQKGFDKIRESPSPVQTFVNAEGIRAVITSINENFAVQAEMVADTVDPTIGLIITHMSFYNVMNTLITNEKVVAASMLLQLNNGELEDYNVDILRGDIQYEIDHAITDLKESLNVGELSGKIAVDSLTARITNYIASNEWWLTDTVGEYKHREITQGLLKGTVTYMDLTDRKTFQLACVFNMASNSEYIQHQLQAKITAFKEQNPEIQGTAEQSAQALQFVMATDLDEDPMKMEILEFSRGIRHGDDYSEQMISAANNIMVAIKDNEPGGKHFVTVVSRMGYALHPDLSEFLEEYGVKQQTWFQQTYINVISFLASSVDREKAAGLAGKVEIITDFVEQFSMYLVGLAAFGILLKYGRPPRSNSPRSTLGKAAAAGGGGGGGAVEDIPYFQKKPMRNEEPRWMQIEKGKKKGEYRNFYKRMNDNGILFWYPISKKGILMNSLLIRVNDQNA